MSKTLCKECLVRPRLRRSARCRTCAHELWSAKKIAAGVDPKREYNDSRNRRRALIRKGVVLSRVTQRGLALEFHRDLRDHYGRVRVAQESLCAICRKPETISATGTRANRLARDHCHVTGGWRGLLCMRCNTGLGRLRSDPDLMKRAIRYLAYFKKVPGSRYKKRDLLAGRGECQLCAEVSPLKRDHCHKTGLRRGLICEWCNLGLGSFKDSVRSLCRAISYVELYTGVVHGPGSGLKPAIREVPDLVKKTGYLRRGHRHYQ